MMEMQESAEEEWLTWLEVGSASALLMGRPLPVAVELSSAVRTVAASIGRNGQCIVAAMRA